MSRLADWASDHPFIDLFASAAIVGLHYAVFRWVGAGDLLGGVNPGTRQGMFSTGAEVIALVGGLCSIAFSILLANQGERSLALRRNYAVALRRNWRSLILTSVGAAALCLAAQGMEGATTATVVPWARWVFEFAVLLTIAAVIRLVWLVNALMAVGDADIRDEKFPPPPALGPKWRKSGPHNDGPNGAQRVAV